MKSAKAKVFIRAKKLARMDRIWDFAMENPGTPIFKRKVQRKRKAKKG